jgi:hypothetical protein
MLQTTSGDLVVVFQPTLEPEPKATLIVRFNGFYRWWTCVHSMEVEITKGTDTEVSFGWSTIFDAYIDAYSQNLAAYPLLKHELLWVDQQKVEGWRASGAISNYYPGATPKLSLTWDMLEDQYQLGVPLIIDMEPNAPFEEIDLSILRYRYYVLLWTDLYYDHRTTPAVKTALETYGGLAHFNALWEFHKEEPDAYQLFDISQKDSFDRWADLLEPGLKIALGLGPNEPIVIPREYYYLAFEK